MLCWVWTVRQKPVKFNVLLNCVNKFFKVKLSNLLLYPKLWIFLIWLFVLRVRFANCFSQHVRFSLFKSKYVITLTFVFWFINQNIYFYFVIRNDSHKTSSDRSWENDVPQILQLKKTSILHFTCDVILQHWFWPLNSCLQWPSFLGTV